MYVADVGVNTGVSGTKVSTLTEVPDAAEIAAFPAASTAVADAMVIPTVPFPVNELRTTL